MADDYEFDVFLSYSRKPPVLDWVRNHFEPELKQWLASHAAYEPKVFVDWEMETGVRWPEKLRTALAKSRCMIAVWDPQYFRSDWCRAEWHVMRQREQLLGLGSGAAKGLIYPIVFSDGEHFPPEAQWTQHNRFHDWNCPYPVYKESVKYLDFVEKMKAVSEELCSWFVNTPPWDSSWPQLQFPESCPVLTRTQKPSIQ